MAVKIFISNDIKNYFNEKFKRAGCEQMKRSGNSVKWKKEEKEKFHF
jgi:hypothetical protein